MNKFRGVLCALSIVSALSGGTAFAATLVIHEVKNDTSAPLTELVGSGGTTNVAGDGTGNMNLARPTGPQISAGVDDPVAHAPIGSLTSAVLGLNFDGQSANDNRALLNGVAYVPPDTNGAVGTKQYVQIVNVTFAVYDKNTGKRLLGPALINALWTGFGGLCESVNGGDPVVLFDHLAKRWIITQLAYNNSLTDNHQCIAVSTSADATGSYYRYDFSFGSNFNDYPKFGIWPDAYYYTANIFGPKSFLGALACAIDRSAMLGGNPATMLCVPNPPSVASLLPADLDGATLPATGEPELFIGIATGDSLNVFHMHPDFTSPANTSYTSGTISVAPFNEICARATDLACIPEPAPGERVDGLGDRLMFRLAYRNYGDHESLVVNHSVAGVPGGAVAGVRWYEIRNPSAPYVYQQGTIYDGAINYWLGSVAMDKAGNIAVGFSASSNALNPSVYLTGRSPTDPPGQTSGPRVLVTGGGVQLNYSYNRWGDYSSMSVDPSDDCTLWYTQEYYSASGAFNWDTRIASFKFNSCR